MYTGLQKNSVSLHSDIFCFCHSALFYLQTTFKQPGWINSFEQWYLPVFKISSSQLSTCTCGIYACLSLLTSSRPPNEMDMLTHCMWIAFSGSEVEWLVPPPPSLRCSVYSHPHTLRAAFPTKPPQPQPQPWGPRASLSQIESQILLGRRNHEAQDEWMARLCRVMLADEWSGLGGQRQAEPQSPGPLRRTVSLLLF